jgi:pseudouridine-5'-phosphate glycosidase
MAVLVEDALQDAKLQRVEGKAVTPFLLSRLLTLSDGRSLTANIALVRNNVRLGAAIACALAEKKASPT